MQAIVVDDELLARMRLKRLLNNIDIDVVAEGSNGQEAIDLVNKHNVDLLFIDIDMPIKNGLEAVFEINKLVDNLPAVIFCTAYSEHAFDAFRTSAVAYLLKPVQENDVVEVVQKASRLSRIQMKVLAGEPGEIIEESLAINHVGALQRLLLDEFVLFRAQDKSVFATLKQGDEILVDKTLKALEVEYCKSLVRVHRNTLVNSKYIHRLVKDETGSVSLDLTINGISLSVSRRHLAEVRKYFR